MNTVWFLVLKEVIIQQSIKDKSLWCVLTSDKAALGSQMMQSLNQPGHLMQVAEAGSSKWVKEVLQTKKILERNLGVISQAVGNH